MTLLAGDEPTATELELLTDKLLARGRRTSTSSGATSSTAVAVLRLDDIPLEGGYSHTIRATGLHPDSTVAADVARVEIRYTTDGSTPTTTSSVLPGAIAHALTANASWPETTTIETEYIPAADETLSLLLCVARSTGTGTVTLFADATYVMEIKVYNSGLDVGDTGTDL